MEQGFIDILKQLVAEQDNAVLTDTKQFKAVLADYTRNEYKKESRFLIQAVEVGVSKAIKEADDLPSCKKAKIHELVEDYGLSQEVSAAIVDTLALVLRGDTSKSVTQVNAVVSETSSTVKETPVHAAPVETSASRQTTSATSSSAIQYKKITTEFTIRGNGQYAKVVIEFERCNEKGLLFTNKIFGGAIPKNYIPGIEKGLIEALQSCNLAGYPDVGIKATLIDGKYHPVDSNELSFKKATIEAFNSYLKQI